MGQISPSTAWWLHRVRREAEGFRTPALCRPRGSTGAGVHERPFCAKSGHSTTAWQAGRNPPHRRGATRRSLQPGPPGLRASWCSVAHGGVKLPRSNALVLDGSIVNSHRAVLLASSIASGAYARGPRWLTRNKSCRTLNVTVHSSSPRRAGHLRIRRCRRGRPNRGVRFHGHGQDATFGRRSRGSAGLPARRAEGGPKADS